MGSYHQPFAMTPMETCMKRLLVAALLSTAAVLPAQADTVTLGGVQWTTLPADNLTLAPTVPPGNQPLNIQCIICGDNQPQQALDFGYTNFKNQGSQDSLVYFSTNVSKGGDPGTDTLGLPYGDGFLVNFFQGLTFNIGIDINDNGNAQTLNSFYMLNLTTDTVLFKYTQDTLLPNINNGTGFPDYTLSGFSLAGVNPGDDILFFARMSNLNDGPDSFFISAPAAVPGPIVGAGLPGLIAGCLGLWGFNRSRRKRTVA